MIFSHQCILPFLNLQLICIFQLYPSVAMMSSKFSPLPVRNRVGTIFSLLARDSCFTSVTCFLRTGLCIKEPRNCFFLQSQGS